MTLSDYFDRLEAPARTVTVYAPPPRPAIADRLETEAGIDAVEYRTLPAAAAAEQGFLVVREGTGTASGSAESCEDERSESSEKRAGAQRHASDDGEFVAAIGLEAAREFLEPPIVSPWAETDDGPYRRVIEVFEATVWRALDRRQLLAISREIETRAWRVGSGTLRASFQRAAALEAMAPVYVRLAGESALDVHAYVADEWDRPSMPGVTVHAEAGPEIGGFWVLTFDGDGDELRTSGLIARERDDETFEGYWTDDAALVAELTDALRDSVD
ncbi:putative sensor protein [Haloterrigena turkmenica DSM 5511]|uniref:Sensor protein n=1 Tax=Haloterrigena turkmenica (strain ATCC 51198 / DSM 5511 / JCM 9101 / NCIMB 13204 / VKM B-1734 / 4k) TaxID=543526 RepID=D2RZ45_HALTV|nr:DICT sensory domain-containing protein [Haloterrigena turkmenica]ADB59969.1 putative sensor protein [Haloterrigena turkmenica DSM 5511]